MPFPDMDLLVRRALSRGLPAAAVLSPKGKVLSHGGELDADEVRAIAAFVCHPRTADFLDRLFAGELITATAGDREICLGIAGRCVFVVTALGIRGATSLDASELFRNDVDAAIADAKRLDAERWTPPGSGPAGSGSPPAEAFAFVPDLRGRRRPGGRN